MNGLTNKGFKRKQYAEIVEDMRTRSRDTFGEDINLKDTSFLGMLINVVAWFVGVLWQLAEKVYYSRFVSTAEGISLDRAAINGGVPRRGAEFATGTCVFTGTGTIPQGTLIGFGELLFETVEQGNTGTPIPIKALEGGVAYNLDEGVIDTLVTELPNVTGIDASATTGGRNVETDAEYRTRYFNSLGAGFATFDAIQGELLRTTGVRGAKVNNEIEVDGPNTYIIGIRPVVLGGSPNDIANALLQKIAHGVKTFGAETGEATAINGEVLEYNFDYATEIDVYANIAITKGVRYPTDGDNQVKRKLAEYIGGTDTDGNIYAGLSLGENVVYSRVIAEIFKIDGVEAVDLELSKDNITFVKVDLEIADIEVAEIAHNRVVIT